MLAQVFSVSRDDDLLGGMWAVVASIFVYRYSYEESAGAALSRMGGNFIKLRSLFYLPALFPVPSLGIGDVDWGGICRGVPASAAGRHNHHRNHDCGRDGRRRHKPGSCVETAHPACGGHNCWSRRWSRWRVDRSQVRPPQEHGGLKNGRHELCKG